MNARLLLRSGFVCLGLAVPAWGQVNHNPVPAAPQDIHSVPADEATGARYRKIGLNGAPMSDEKPQNVEETDQESEETFVDAMTLGLRHATTDIYVKVPASDLAISVRRNAISESWGMKNGLHINERIDRPFGAGWTSNLSPDIEFSCLVGSALNANNPDTAVVTDENGEQYTFVIAYIPPVVFSPTDGLWGGPMRFVPKPTGRHEQDTYLTTLTADGQGNFTFKKKYGTTLFYTMMPGLAKGLPTDRIYPAGSFTLTKYARLYTVRDRFGSGFNYSFSATDKLTPSRIQMVVPDTVGGPAIIIAKNSDGVISDITDPKGNNTHYDYVSFSYTDPALAVSFTPEYRAQLVAAGVGTDNFQKLMRVYAPTGGVTGYDYDFKEETDLAPNPSGDYVFPHLHFDIASITDPLGNVYRFDYQFDIVKYDYLNLDTGGVYFQKTGLPRLVSTVTLPDGGKSYFNNAGSYLPAQLGGDVVSANPPRRQSAVVDAKGNHWNYQFTGIQMALMDGLIPFYTDYHKFDAPRLFLYNMMTIAGPQGVQSFQFSPLAGMALVQATDFSNNTTLYAYGDSYQTSTIVTYGFVASGIFGNYSDPTSQTNALGKAKAFTYGTNRVMTSSTDELGVKTQWTVDSLGRRLDETITAADGTVMSVTTFDYKDTAGAYLDPAFDYAKVSLNFMTKKTVRKLSTAVNDPSWVSDLVTVFVPVTTSVKVDPGIPGSAAAVVVMSLVGKEITDPGAPPHLNLVTR